jgi:hypothetical protein
VVSDVKPMLGWVAKIVRVSGNDIVVAFVKGQQQVQFTATRFGASLASRIERRFDHDFDHPDDGKVDDHHAGRGDDHHGRDLCACDGRPR